MMTSVLVDEYDPALGYHPSVIPMDIRLGLTSPPAAAVKPLRWGILACSKVSHDFSQVLKFLSSRHTIAAVGSRSIERAKAFARLHTIPKAHGSYEELCADPTVDIVYVASLHPYHKKHAEMALNNGKHVLVEKPMTIKADDAQYLYNLGKRLDLFVGEGMWTRFFPAVEWTRIHLGTESADGIGNVRVIQADFSIDGDDVGPYPTDSLYAKDLGGGTCWTVMPYVVGAAMLPFGKEPQTIAANGIIPDDDAVGDLALGMTLTFETAVEGRKDGMPENQSIASGLVSYLAESSEITTYAAKGGRIIIAGPAHCPTSAKLVKKSAGRGNGATSEASNDVNKKTSTVEFPLPKSTPEIEESGGIRLPNSMGFVYEAEAVRRLVAAGRTTFPQWTPDESVGCLRTIEAMLKQVKQNN